MGEMCCKTSLNYSQIRHKQRDQRVYPNSVQSVVSIGCLKLSQAHAFIVHSKDRLGKDHYIFEGGGWTICVAQGIFLSSLVVFELFLLAA